MTLKQTNQNATIQSNSEKGKKEDRQHWDGHLVSEAACCFLLPSEFAIVKNAVNEKTENECSNDEKEGKDDN